MKIKYYIFINLIVLFLILIRKNIYENFDQNSIYFYTFCVDIGRHSRENLIFSLKILVSSLNRYVKNYKLVVFKNFDIDFYDPNIIFRDYYQGEIKLYKNDKWRELSFNKLNIFKDLHIEFNKSFIWLDLDTIIMYDISYFNNHSNVFIVNGGLLTNEKIIFTNNSNYKVKNKDYIQGNVWKINLNIYNKLVNTLNKDIKPRNLNLRYDLQDLFNYQIYYKNDTSNYNLLGKNIHKNLLNGLAIWENPKKRNINHGDLEGVRNLYKKDNVLKTKYYPKFDIHIISITFYVLNKIKNKKDFKNLLDFK